MATADRGDLLDHRQRDLRPRSVQPSRAGFGGLALRPGHRPRSPVHPPRGLQSENAPQAFLRQPCSCVTTIFHKPRMSVRAAALTGCRRNWRVGEPIRPLSPGDSRISGTLNTSKSVSSTVITRSRRCVFVVVLAAYLALLLSASPHTTGDEPHYLLIAESMFHDRDISMANNYDNVSQLQSVYPDAGRLDTGGHAGVYSAGGPTVPVHNVGLPALLTTVIALGQGWFAARLLMVFLSALVAPLMLIILDRIFPARPAVAVVAVLATSLTAPLVFYSNQIYPDVPGALLVTVAVCCIVAGRNKAWALVVSACAAALLPWFHVRLSILAAAIALALVIRATRPTEVRVPGSQDPERLTAGRLLTSRAKRLRLIGVFAPLLISAMMAALLNEKLYGSPLPEAVLQIAALPTPAFIQHR